jgi:uncharacterized membrane protein YozB (DUF420 family)
VSCFVLNFKTLYLWCFELHLKTSIYECNLRASGLWFYYSVLDSLYFLFREIHTVLEVAAMPLLLPRLKTHGLIWFLLISPLVPELNAQCDVQQTGI